jgi:hypothetical protein
MRDDFSKKAKSPNGHLYIKVLKEQIADELQLSAPTEAKDLTYEALNEGDPSIKIDVEGKYNTSHINNLEAMGYDNFEKRMENNE